jgi:uncharacterized membrane protein
MRIRPRRGAPTETGRLEAFSDGVFAVAITLLALVPVLFAVASEGFERSDSSPR